jgi:hypothetical protein
MATASARGDDRSVLAEADWQGRRSRRSRLQADGSAEHDAKHACRRRTPSPYRRDTRGPDGRRSQHDSAAPLEPPRVLQQARRERRISHVTRPLSTFGLLAKSCFGRVPQRERWAVSGAELSVHTLRSTLGQSGLHVRGDRRRAYHLRFRVRANPSRPRFIGPIRGPFGSVLATTASRNFRMYSSARAAFPPAPPAPSSLVAGCWVGVLC